MLEFLAVAASAEAPPAWIQWLPIIGSGALTADEADALRDLLESNLEIAVREHLEMVDSLMPAAVRHELAGLLDFAAGNLAEEGALDSPIVQLAGCTALPPAVAAAVPLWTGVSELLLTQAGAVRKQVTKRLGFPADRKAEARPVTARRWARGSGTSPRASRPAGT